MNYREWEAIVPDEIKGDSVWKAEAYRLALFTAELAWHDATKLVRDKRTISLADQLLRAAGGVSGDIEEGYSRGTGKDCARFYEYGLGSAREARGWYFKGRHVLGAQVTPHQIRLLTHVVKLLLTMVTDQRGQTLREEPPSYRITLDPGAELSPKAHIGLLESIPMP